MYITMWNKVTKTYGSGAKIDVVNVLFLFIATNQLTCYHYSVIILYGSLVNFPR